VVAVLDAARDARLPIALSAMPRPSGVASISTTCVPGSGNRAPPASRHAPGKVTAEEAVLVGWLRARRAAPPSAMLHRRERFMGFPHARVAAMRAEGRRSVRRFFVATNSSVADGGG
jgi:hypothetical protein